LAAPWKSEDFEAFGMEMDGSNEVPFQGRVIFLRFHVELSSGV